MAIDICKQDQARTQRRCRSEALANWELAKARALALEGRQGAEAAQAAYEVHARQVLATLRARRGLLAWLRRLLGR